MSISAETCEKLFKLPWTWQNRKLILDCLSHKSKIDFAVLCAEEVVNLSINNAAQNAFNVAKLYLSGETTIDRCSSAINHAWRSRDEYAYLECSENNLVRYISSYASSALIDAASAAVSVGHDAMYAAFASYAAIAAIAAKAAAETASSTLDSMNAAMAVVDSISHNESLFCLKDRQLAYLRSLIIAELPPDLRDNWLLQATL